MKKIASICLLAFLCFASCKRDILDRKPLDIYTDVDVYGSTDPTLFNTVLNEIYAQTPTLVQDATEVANAGGSNQRSEFVAGPFYTNGLSDEARNVWNLGSGGNPNDFKPGTLRNNGGASEYWEQGYRAIRAANDFIEKAPASPIPDATLKARRIAEARFLRAFNYFSLVKRYGGVPLITRVQQLSDPREVLYPVRDPEQKVYDYIISEMDEIATVLPEAWTGADWGRPSRFAALSLQCRAALYAGSIAKYGTVQLNGIVGIPASAANAYFQKAFDAATAIKASGRFSLYNALPGNKEQNFKNIFLVKGTSGNTEAIMAKTHNSGTVSAGNPWSWDYGQSPKPNPIDQGNINAPYLEMVEAFEKIDGSSGAFDRAALQTGTYTTGELFANKDPRFFATIWTANSTWKGTYVDPHNGLLLPNGTVQPSGTFNGIPAQGPQRGATGLEYGTSFGVMKYLDSTVTPSTLQLAATSTTDYLIFRYGETLLNLAEAAFELGRSGDALTAINEIRSRAGIAALAGVDINRIRQERRVELAFENHRYWDVRRWRIATTVLSQPNSGLRYILDVSTLVGAPGTAAGVNNRYRIQVLNNIDGAAAPLFRPENYYFPITPGRRNVNTNLVENPGY